MNLTINDFDIVVFDLDGTIYNGDTLITSADKVVDFCRQNKKKIIFGTNNSGKNRQQIADKLNKIGISCSEEEIITSAFLAGIYLKENHINDIYVFGSDNLKKEIISNGVNIVDEKEAKNLLIGFKKDYDYEDLSKAFRVAKKANHFIVCNKDRTYPSNDGTLYPALGYITSSIEWCANRQADVMIGKPDPYMLSYIAKKYNVSNDRILCIGDTYESDYLTSKAFGSKCVLISDKVYKENNLFSINKIADLLNLVK